MRTAAREVIQVHFPHALPDKPPVYHSKKGAQEAHECIRPTNPALLPDDAPLKGSEAALYQLIWTRFIGSQMKPAIYHVVVATIQPAKGDQALPYQFAAQGKSLHSEGWLVLEKKKKDDETLPRLQAGQPLTLKKLQPKEQWTKAPSRYTEPKLIQALEKAGVGRPSTYASIMETIQERGYVTDTGKSLAPTESGQAVTQFLIKQFPELLDLDFTKQMEDDLDRIAAGQVVWQVKLSEFHTKLTEHLNDTKQTLIDEGILKPCPNCPSVIATLKGKYGEYQRCLSCDYKPTSGKKTGESCPECGKPLVERTGKHGKFVSCSGYPECKYRPLNTTGESCPDCGQPLVEKKSKKGNFIGCSGYPECKYIKPTNTTGENCPECNKSLVEKKSKKGNFIGCSGYPECKYIKPTNTTGENCPDCGKPLVQKKSSYGSFIGCSGYPSCKYIHRQ